MAAELHKPHSPYKAKARDLVGYSALQFMVQAPIVLFLCWLFGWSMEFVAPLIK